jgi:hypothetical protein
VDAARGSHTRWQEGHVSVLSVRGAIVANLFSSGAVEYFVRIIRTCVCLLLQYLIQSCARGGRRIEHTCASNLTCRKISEYNFCHRL